MKWTDHMLLSCGCAALILAADPVLQAGDTASAGSETAAQTSLRTLRKSREALLFYNGDLLYGRLESITRETGIRWRQPDVDEVIQFKPDAIAEIHFPPHSHSGGPTVNTCRVQLRTGDELEGEVAQCDGEKLVLHTWYAGEITIPRPVLQSILPVPPEGVVVFKGPTGREGWTIGKIASSIGDAGEWQYRNGAFYATNAASIARDVKLPDVSSLEFDMAWKGLFQIAVALYTDYLQPISLGSKESEPDFGAFYSLQLNSFSANLLPIKKTDPLRYLGQVSVPAFSQKNTAHIEIRASKPKRMIALLVDGQLIKQWVDNEEFAGQGRGIRFVNQPQGKVKLSNIRVSTWDGQFDERPGAGSVPNQDVARLRNGDKITGQFDSIREGKVLMATSDTKLEVPLSRVKQIELAAPKQDAAFPHSGDIRATFTRGGAITFQLEKWEAGKVLGTSASLGKLAFDPDAFSRVQLRLKPTPP